jgi:hypothetical protein
MLLFAFSPPFSSSTPVKYLDEGNLRVKVAQAVTAGTLGMILPWEKIRSLRKASPTEVGLTVKFDSVAKAN